MNLIDLLQGDGFSLNRVAATHGGEYCGPCPRCSGHDRFRVWPQWSGSKGGRYWCRGCGWSGDGIEYLKTFRQMSFKEACNYLGCEVSTNLRRLSSQKSKPRWEPKAMQTPSGQWQSKAREYLKETVYHLWAAEGHRWVGWLKEIRGLNEATIRTYQLGLQPRDRWEERESWGLAPVVKDNGCLKKLWLPEGLVIPYFINDQISQISFRRKKSAHGPRYLHLEGSQSHPMVLHPGRDILVLVESALDGFLLVQEADDLAGVLILGSAKAQPGRELAELLRLRRLLLLALDADEAGSRKAWRWWIEQFPNARRWPPIRGKDPGEMLQQGIDVRLWIEVGITRFLDEVVEPEEENDICRSRDDHHTVPLHTLSSIYSHKEETSVDNEAQTENISPLYENEGELSPQSQKHVTCFECAHFRPAVKSPNPGQAWGYCEKRKRGRYGVATACEALENVAPYPVMSEVRH